MIIHSAVSPSTLRFNSVKSDRTRSRTNERPNAEARTDLEFFGPLGVQLDSFLSRDPNRSAISLQAEPR